MTKPEMRRQILSRLRAIPEAELAERSLRVGERLRSTAAWNDADTILCFLSMPHELVTVSILEAARRKGGDVAVPRIEGERIRFVILPRGQMDLVRDRFGIPVPDPDWPSLETDRAGRILVVTPGLAFDRQGNRLGRGKAYYDRFLGDCRAAASERVTALGVCLKEQLVDAVPYGPRDQRVDGVVSELETILGARSR